MVMWHEADIVEIVSKKQKKETRREEISKTPGLSEGIRRLSDKILYRTKR